MRIALRRLATLGLLGMAGLTASSPAARAEVPAEKSLPGTTLAFVKVEDAKQLREGFRASQLGQLLADPALQPLKDDVASKVKETDGKVRAKIGLSIGELLELPQGELSLAVVATEGGPQPVALLIAADAGANQQKMDELMEKLTGLAKEDKAEVTTEEFKGLTLHTLKGAEGEGDSSPPVVWTRQGSVFRLSTSAAALKDVLAKSDGREDSLAAKASFRDVAGKVGTDGQILWYIDLEQVMKLVVQAAGAQGGNAGQIETQLKLTGLDGLKAIGGRAGVSVGGYDTLSKIFLSAPGESEGLLRLFVMPQADLKPQPWVPANVASYQSMSWDLDAAYKALSDLVDTVAPGVLAGLEQQLAGPQGDGLAFEKDIFGPLGDRITVIGDVKKSTGEDGLPEQRLLFAVALEDPKAFENTLNKIYKLFNASPKERKFQGATIYDFELPEIPNAEAAGLSGAVSLTIAKDNLLVATDATLLEQILRGGGPGLADNPAFQAMLPKLPARSSTLSFQRAEDQARALYDMIKSGQLKQAIEAGANNAGNDLELGDLIDPKKLPDFSVFAKYLTQSAGFGVMEPDGVTFTQFSLKKAQP
jgi:hypothetical protein